MHNAMHTLESNSSNVPAFLVKLWKLVEDPTCDDLIAWNDSGYSFIIKDQTTFAKDLLPQYFKHNNMASFVRQLNMYGFKKVMNIEKSGLKNDNNEMEFQHGFFIKERCELLELIKRKISNPKIVEAPVAKTNAKDILVDLTSIREKQENMDNMLLKMKSENELLWRELTSMRQKHKAQEQIIQKVIQFLVSIVQRNNPNIGVQRKISRMLHNSPNSKANSSQVSTRTIDVLRKKNSDCIIVPEQMVSPLGPVIHEVLDGEENPGSVASQNISVASPSVKSPESAVESTNDTAPKYHIVSILNNPTNSSGTIEPFRLFEAFTPRTPDAENENTVEESILGIPLECVTMQADAEGSNVISIPDNGDLISVASDDNIGNVISIPDENSLNDIITLSEDNSSFNEIATVPDVGSSTKCSENNSDSNDKQGDVKEIVSNFLTSNIVSLCDLQPSTSQSSISYSNDFQDDILSESLQTPRIHNVDEDPYMSPQKDSKPKSMEVRRNNSNQYQVATTESSSLAKNVLSNHLLSVDEKLNFTQDRLASNPWNFDVQKLLGVCASPYSWTSLDTQLFSGDELGNYDAFTNHLSDEINIKSEPNDVTGNELVQFSPNMLDVGIDIANSPLFEALTEHPEVLGDELTYQSSSLLDDVLNETDTLERDDSLYNEVNSNLSPNKRRKATPNSAKSKRRKAN